MLYVKFFEQLAITQHATGSWTRNIVALSKKLSRAPSTAALYKVTQTYSPTQPPIV